MYKLSKTRQNKIRIAQREEVRNAFAKAERRIIDWNRWHNRNDGSGTVVGWLERVEIIEELALTLLSKCDAYRTVWEEHKEK